MKTMDITDEAADEFERCRKLVRGVTSEPADNSIAMLVITRGFLKYCGVEK